MKNKLADLKMYGRFALGLRGFLRHRMSLAGCQPGDVRNMVRTKELETTLRELREAGVYITFEEYKGRKPLVRNGKVFDIQPIIPI